MPPKGRRKAAPLRDVPDVYRDMLAEAVPSPMRSDDDGRSVKKRRVAGRIVQQTSNATGSANIKHEDADQARSIDDSFAETIPQRIVLSESEDSADSDVDWENVELKDEPKDESGMNEPAEEPRELNITLSDTRASSSDRPKRKAVTALEKKLRLEVHKMNLCCLLAHCHNRNYWCNDDAVHSVLRKYLSNKTISYLNPAESLSQFQRSRSFMDGLQQASDTFRGQFHKSARGMARPQWSDPQNPSPAVLEDIELPMEKEDFIDAARSVTGSRDTGAQLFCSMLRGVGVDARMVCSLQPLQFRAVEKAATPQRRYTKVIQEPWSRQSTPEYEHIKASSDAGSPIQIGSPVGISRYDGNSRDGHTKQQLSERSKQFQKPIREPKFPIFWVEAFNEAVQKWVPVDPLVTQSIAKPSKFEPPMGERDNNLSYVLAFEEDGFARDVTRRYAKAFNAKTRRDRVESTKGGERWWRRVMKIFRGPHQDREQLEDAELAAKEAAEPMPRNVLDFKDHPYYALERHLRRHEVIHPKREVGNVGAAGKGHNSRVLEPIYRRRDVQHVLSADKWFRQGREVQMGQQPLKHVLPRRRRERSLDPDEEMLDADQAGTPLYSLNQTSLYRPAPVTESKIPKNQYGNLDIYVPSMIPAGGAHIQHPAAARAAKMLGIDFADAVTGFKFSGRHGTAVTNGVIIAAKCVEAVREIITALEDEKAAIEQEKRSARALGIWKRLMTGLRIRERIEGYDIEGEPQNNKAGVEDGEEADASDHEDGGGGFFADAEAEAEPTLSTSNEAPTAPLDDSIINHHHPFPRPALHIPITYGPPPLSAAQPASPRRRSPPQPDLFADDDDDDDDDASSPSPGPGNENEDDAIQLAIQRSLSTQHTTTLGTPPNATTAVWEKDVNLAPKADVEMHGVAIERERASTAGSSGGNAAAATVLPREVGRVGDMGGRMVQGEGEIAEREAEGGRVVEQEDDGGGKDESDDGEVSSLLSHDPEDDEAEDAWPESPMED